MWKNIICANSEEDRICYFVDYANEIYQITWYKTEIKNGRPYNLIGKKWQSCKFLRILSNTSVNIYFRNYHL